MRNRGSIIEKQARQQSQAMLEEKDYSWGEDISYHGEDEEEYSILADLVV